MLTWIDLSPGHRDLVLGRLPRAPAAPAGGRPAVPVLAPGLRMVVSELLTPAPGEHLDQAVVATGRVDPGLLALLHEAVEPPRLAVFVDSSGEVTSDPVVHPVAAPNGGTFRPEVWVARFRGARDAVRLRLVVLTGPLGEATPSSVALTLEARPSARQASRPSRPLADLLLSLPAMAVRVPDRVGATLASLADDLSRSRFRGPGGLDATVHLHVLGLSPKERAWGPTREGSRLLVVSPVVEQALLDRVAPLGSRSRILVSTRETLDELPDAALERWPCVLAAEEPAGGSLNARMLAIERGFDVTWWLGSAELSRGSWTGRNVELVAEVRGRKGRDRGKTGHGIGRFLRSGFETLCSPYRDLAEDTEDRGG